MKLDNNQLEKIGMFINEDSFKSIERILSEYAYAHDSLSGITESPFENGKVFGTLYGMRLMLKRIQMIRDEVEKLAEEKRHG